MNKKAKETIILKTYEVREITITSDLQKVKFILKNGKTIDFEMCDNTITAYCEDGQVAIKPLTMNHFKIEYDGKFETPKKEIPKPSEDVNPYGVTVSKMSMKEKLKGKQ